MGVDAAPACLQMATSYVTRSHCFMFSIPRPANIIKHAEGWPRTDGSEPAVVCSIYLVRFLIRMLNFCKVIRFYYKAGILFIFDCQILKSFVFLLLLN